MATRRWFNGSLLAVGLLAVWGLCTSLIVTPEVVILDPGADLQGAIDGLPRAGGTIKLSAGTYTMPTNTTLYFPCDRPVMLEGVGFSFQTPYVDTLGGTVLKFRNSGAYDLVKLRGDHSRIKGLTIWNCSGDTASVEEAGRGVVIGREVMVDRHPGSGGSSDSTEWANGGRRVWTNIRLEDVQIYRSPGWGLFVPGWSTLSDETTKTVGDSLYLATGQSPIGIWCTFQHVQIVQSQKYGNIYLGCGNTTNNFLDCVSGSVGDNQVPACLPDSTVGAAWRYGGYYIYSRGACKCAFDRCTIEGTNTRRGMMTDTTGTGWVRLVGTQTFAFRNCWFEEDAEADSVVSPTPFIYLRGSNWNPSITSNHFARSGHAMGKLRLLYVYANVDGAGAWAGEFSGNLVTSGEHPYYDCGPPVVWKEANALNFGVGNSSYAYSNRGWHVARNYVWDMAANTAADSVTGQVLPPYPVPVANAPRTLAVESEDLLRVPGGTTGFLSTIEASSQNALNGALASPWGVSADSSDTVNALWSYWNTGWKLANNAPSLTTGVRDLRTWQAGDMIINLTVDSLQVYRPVNGDGNTGATGWWNVVRVRKAP